MLLPDQLAIRHHFFELVSAVFIAGKIRIALACAKRSPRCDDACAIKVRLA
jgi:hypothetical protein